MFLTTTQKIAEGEDLLNLDVENFPMSLTEVMLFKLEANREIAAQKLFKILPDIELARVETINSVIPDTSFLVLKIGE